MMRTIIAGWHGRKLIVFIWGINGIYSERSDVVSAAWTVEKSAVSEIPTNGRDPYQRTLLSRLRFHINNFYVGNSGWKICLDDRDPSLRIGIAEKLATDLYHQLPPH